MADVGWEGKITVAGGVKKVPMIMQMEALECGAACLDMILAYFGKWVPLEQVRADCGVSRDGSRALNILKAARSYGLEAAGYSFDIDDLREVETPCILFWNFNHFVVFDGFRGNRAYLNDPGRGIIRVSMDEFDRSFTGVALCFSKTEAFESGGKPTSMVDFVRSRVSGMTASFILVALTAIITSVVNVADASFSRVFIDRILSGTSPGWIGPLIAIMGAFAVVQCIVGIISAVNIVRIQGKLAVVSSSRFMWHLLRLPLDFYSQRMVGDLQQRQASNETIAYTLVSQLAPVALNVVLLVFYLVVMLRYSVMLTIAGLAGIIINMLVVRLVARKRVNVSRVQMRDAGKLYSTTVSGIEMIETIKASGAENGFFERWSGIQASVNDSQVRFAKVSQYLGAIPGVVAGLVNIAILMQGTFLIMQGAFTVGMLLAFQGLLANFLAPANSLLSLGQNLQEMRTSMERVQDVLLYPTDVDGAAEDIPTEQEVADKTEPDLRKLTGKMEISHLTFGYSPLEEPVIRDLDLVLEPGSWVALVGSSGCGKSTIAKLIAGLYKPWEGEIRMDGKPLCEIPPSVLRGSVSSVDQDITLFQDTVSENIRLWDGAIEDYEVILAAHDAQIYDDIMQREGGFKGEVLPSGRNFSGGERQRLEIARALAQDPSLLILDEATSALDAKTEQLVIQAIRRRALTCVVVAHRLSTIRDCDEIIVLDGGVVAERGTHEELMAKGGRYAALVGQD